MRVALILAAAFNLLSPAMPPGASAHDLTTKPAMVACGGFDYTPVASQPVRVERKRHIVRPYVARHFRPAVGSPILHRTHRLRIVQDWPYA